VDPPDPLKVEVGLDVLATLPPLPLTILHDPVPTEGEFAARVTELSPHVAEPV
jgi:hypothetical protein